jgi:hypothetical protein
MRRGIGLVVAALMVLMASCRLAPPVDDLSSQQLVQPQPSNNKPDKATESHEQPVPGTSVAYTKVDASSVVNKVIVGYQGWFNTPKDGSPIGKWQHWVGSGVPSPGHLAFEMYPDLREYPASTLYPTGFAPLGNGDTSKLYTGYSADVLKLHFRWMAEYGIDGAALQRFGTSLKSASLKQNRDSVALKMKDAAEQYGRIFYIMYDTADMQEDTFVQAIERDWKETIVGELKLNASEQYAKQDGKPVVNVYGLGYESANRPGTKEHALELIRWFQAEGCYVIGGVPTYWREGNNGAKADYDEVYKAFDMVMPWTVGRFAQLNKVDTYYEQTLIGDRQYLQQYGIAYQPVIHAGFAWSNKKPGSPKNSEPRRAGELLWKQAFNIRQAGIPGAYLAMFDEFDEGTAIAKAAEDSSMIPTDQYFLTLSADGTYVSSDYYLRLAGRATAMIEGKLEPTPTVPIAPSEGPVYFRTGLEPNLDAKLTWENTIDQEGAEEGQAAGLNGVDQIELRAVADGNAHRGKSSLKVSGNAQEDRVGDAYANIKAFAVDIPVTPQTKLAYWFKPADESGRHTIVDLVMENGATLRSSPVVDANGDPMSPTVPRGQVGGWTQVVANIGGSFAGRSIRMIRIAYDDPSPGEHLFSGYMDDIVVTTGEPK